MDAPPAGTVIAQRYQVTAPLPTTGAALVAHATSLADHKPVLLKLLHPRTFGPVSHDAEDLARTAEAFSHAGAIRMVDHGQAEDGTPYRVFEPPTGYALSALLAHSGPLPDAVVADLALQMLAVLEAAHERGLAHGNLHPDNVFLVDTGNGGYRVSLMDLGMPRPVPQGLDGTEAEERMRDASYAAPELLHGSPPDAQSDLYALGLLLAEALTSQTIVTGASPIAITLAQASDKPVDLPAAVLQSSLGPAIISATRKPLERRAQSAGAMREQIAQASVSQSVDVGQAMTGYMNAIPDLRAGPSAVGPTHHAQQGGPMQGQPMQGQPMQGQPMQGQPTSPYGASAHGASPYAASPSVAAHGGNPYAAHPSTAHAGHPMGGQPSAIGAHPSAVGHAYPHAPGAYPPPGGSYLGAPGQPRPSSRKKSSSNLGILLIVGAVGLLVLGFGGVGLFLLVRDDGSSSSGRSSSSSDDDDDRRLGGGDTLGEMSPNKLKGLLTDDGWSIQGTSNASNSAFSLDSFTVQRDREFGVVHLYRYDSEDTAEQVFKTMQRQSFGASKRDGRAILVVAIGGTGASAKRNSERILDELLAK